MANADDTHRSFSTSRLSAFLEQLAEMSALAEKAKPLPISSAADELDAIAYAFNVLLGELGYAYEAKARSEAERLAEANRTAELERERSDQLRRAKEAADSANREKSAFLRNISHELRTPVTVLVASAQAMARNKLENDEHALVSERIVRSAAVLLGLLNNVLDMAKIEAGKFEASKEPFRLIDILTDTKLCFEAQAREKNLMLEIDDGSALPSLLGDCQRIRQILFNLVGNAVKYTNEGRVRVVAELDEDVAGCALTLSVEDTGQGISEADQKRLFAPFGRASSAASIEGTGLGLHLSSRLAELLGGTLRLTRSEPGRGSCFVLRVPVTVTAGAPAEPSFSLQKSMLTGMRVLLVDDSDDIRGLYAQMLLLEGAIVTTAADGAEAVVAARRENFDVIVMDVHMPKKSGLEAARELRREGYDKPIIALTADVTREQREECIAMGYTGYLPKPVDFDELLSTLVASSTAG